MSILTLSNHEPFALPDSSCQVFSGDADSSLVFNSQRYADHALGTFLQLLTDTKLTDSTWLVLTADHARKSHGRAPLDPKVMRIPLLIIPPGGLTEGIAVSTIGSQVDILPTLMSLLGGEFTHSSWGRDLLNLADGDQGFAILNANDRVGYLDAEYFYFEWLGRSPKLYHTESLSEVPTYSSGWLSALEKRQLRLRHYLQAAEQLRLADQVIVK